MYNINNSKERINNVLKLLKKNQNGKITDKDRELIKNEQKTFGFPQTGIVDFKTFEALRDKYYFEKLKRRFNDGVDYSALPLSFGSQGDTVGYINFLISNVLKNYTYEGRLPSGSFFGRDSVKAAVTLRKIFNMEKKEEFDDKLYIRIRLELKNK